MSIKFTVVSSTAEGSNYRVIGADQSGREINVLLPFGVDENREIVLDAEEGSSGGSVPS